MTLRTIPEETAGRQRGDLRALGLAGFGLPLFVASVAWAGFLPEERATFAIPLAVVLGVITVAAAGLSYQAGDSFSGTMLGTLGAFWLSWAMLEWMLQANLLPVGNDREGLLALFFGGWAVLIALIAIAASVDTLADMLILTGAALTCAGLAAGYAMAGIGWTNAAGWAGLVTAALCGYTTLADVVNDALHRSVLPVVPLAHPAAR